MAVADGTLRTELLRLAALDQAFRAQPPTALNPAALERAMADEVSRGTRISQIIAAVGWPGASLVGEDGSDAAWLLLQHADQDVALQQRALLLLKKAVAHGEASPRCLAYLTDRVCVNLDQPQIYGTQFHVVDDRLMPFPIADPAHLEERRANVKLEPFAENEQPVRQMADARPAPTQAHEGSAVTSVEGGWEDSAGAWIASLGAEGDFTRRYVTDPAVLERIQGRGFRYGLDVGCGEGRFCRILRQLGVATVGVDPTPSLISEAVRRDPTGDYRLGRAEALDFAHGSFDLVVSYLALIDIPDIQAAIAEMTRVLAPGGTLMIVNLASFSTAGGETGWVKDAQGQPLYFAIDRYLEERAIPAEWDGINIINWHRPLSTYMSLLLEQELRLIHFAEPRPRGCDDAHEVAEYERAPWAYVMEWRNDRKPRRAKRAVDPTSS